jgi:hypothetical protein
MKVGHWNSTRPTFQCSIWSHLRAFASHSIYHMTAICFVFRQDTRFVTDAGATFTASVLAIVTDALTFGASVLAGTSAGSRTGASPGANILAGTGAVTVLGHTCRHWCWSRCWDILAGTGAGAGASAFAGVDAGTGAEVVVVAAGGGYTATQIQLPAGWPV